MKTLTGAERFALERFGGVPKEIVANMETSQLELFLGHDLLSELVEPSEHERIHAVSVGKFADVRLKAPELADTAEKGDCLYHMLCYLYIKKKGRENFELLKKTKYPGLM